MIRWLSEVGLVVFLFLSSPPRVVYVSQCEHSFLICDGREFSSWLPDFYRQVSPMFILFSSYFLRPYPHGKYKSRAISILTAAKNTPCQSCLQGAYTAGNRPFFVLPRLLPSTILRQVCAKRQTSVFFHRSFSQVATENLPFRTLHEWFDSY